MANPIQDAVHKFRFERFDSSTEEWEYYIQRFETELQLHNLLEGDESAAARRSLLLSKVGPAAFKVLVDHFRPEAVNTKSYNELKGTLGRQFKKDTCIIAERVKFTLRHRKEGETVTQFIIALRAIAGSCAFGASLNERLRDQLVIGISNDSWQQELFRTHTTNDATLQQVETTALILEQAATQQQRIREMARGEQPTETNTRKVTTRLRGKQEKHIKQSVLELKKGSDCLKCGRRKHSRGEHCPAEGSSCRACGELNHFANVCIKSGRATIQGSSQTQLHAMGMEAEQEDWKSQDSDSGEEINTVKIRALKAYSATVEVLINRKFITMVAYTNVAVETLGEALVEVKAFGLMRKVLVMIVARHDTPLFGLDWCIEFGVQMPPGVKIGSIKQGDTGMLQGQLDSEVQALITEFGQLFEDKPSTIIGHKAVVHLKSGAIPKVHSARPIPFPMRRAVETELERLVEQGVIEAVDASTTPIEWASPIVCTKKSSGEIRICVDFKTTINPHIYIDPHPLPRFEEIMSRLSGSRYFTKLDLRDAYLQMEVDVASRKYLVVATHAGYFRYKRLPFGVNFAPALFQKMMDKVLTGLPQAAAFIDDIIVGGKTKQEHITLLREVFLRLQRINVRIKKAKCKFMVTEVTYLGHRIDEHGIHPTEEHIEALRQMPTPTNKKELRSFLGSMNFYSRFIPQLQSMCAPLHVLVKQDVKWTWSRENDCLFKKLKGMLTAKDTLMHYSSDLPLVLTTDASDHGVGAVLMHQLPDGTEKPVAYASRILDHREKQYSTIDKEALAIIFGVTKFYQYIYGRKFLLRSDHKPLERILGAQREIPKMAANRLQRWAITLSAFDYELQYVHGKHNIIADPLSRMPLQTSTPSTSERMGHKYNLLNLRVDDLPMTKSELRNLTLKDAVLKQICSYVERGWPQDRARIPEHCVTFYEKRESLSFEEGILLWGGRIVVPEVFRKKVLQTLHEGHPGIWAMRALSRFYVWWPKIDDEVEQYVKGCDRCQENRTREPETLLYSWNIPSEPWSRIHVDYAGPFEGKYWLVVIDAYSKWLEIKECQSTTAAVTIKLLREMFCRLGVPKLIVSDNGPQFASLEFKHFCISNNVTHVRSTPYHPKTNGLAERAVRTFKERVTMSRQHTEDLELRVQKFLISYRNTPQKSTNRAPSELLMGRRLRTKLDLLKPDTSNTMDKALVKQKLYHDRGAKPRWFFEGESVWVQKTNDKGYEAGKIVKRQTDHSYLVMIQGIVRRKHADQLRLKSDTSTVETITLAPIIFLYCYFVHLNIFQ